MELDKIIENVDDMNILNSWMVANSKLSTYRKILCAVSGGSDSDILVHLCATLDENKRVTYVFFDTGLEFQATKDHIKYLESKYGIKIETRKAVKPIPACCKQYGIPFLSKEVSENIDRLQRHGFDWRDGTYEELVKEIELIDGMNENNVNFIHLLYTQLIQNDMESFENTLEQFFNFNLQNIKEMMSSDSSLFSSVLNITEFDFS